MSIAAMKMDAAGCNARLPAIRKGEIDDPVRGNSIAGLINHILAAARGREFTLGDAGHWTGRARHQVAYTVTLMVERGFVERTGSFGRAGIYRATGRPPDGLHMDLRIRGSRDTNLPPKGRSAASEGVVK